MSAKDSCNRRLEDATISAILYSFGQGNLTFIREKSAKRQGILKTDVCGNHVNRLVLSGCLVVFIIIASTRSMAQS